MSSIYSSSSSSYYSKNHLFHRTILHPLRYRHTLELPPCFRAKQYGALHCRDGKKLDKDNATATSTRKLSSATAAKGGSPSDVSSSSTKGSEKKKGTILGAVSLIVGTSIGSGILALPQRTSPAGFMPSAISITLCWAFLVIEALLIAEINVHLRRKLKKAESRRNSDDLQVLSLRSMAQETLGEGGGNLAATTYLCLAYTSMVAYTSKSGELLSRVITLPASTSGIIFTLALALLISVGGTDITDQVNQWLTVSMIGLLLGIEVVALSSGGFSAMTTSNWGEIPQAIPVIIFSLVFHDIAPVICAYLGGDIKRVRLSILLGSLLPLFSLLVWNYIALSLPHQPDSIDTLGFLARGSMLLPVVDIFSILAVGTSSIGTLLGFSQFFLEQLVNLSNAPPLVQTREMSELDVTENQQSQHNQENWWGRNILTFLATSMAVLPSMLISTIVPDAFSAATDIAGGYCMTILYGVLPPAMAWALQHSRPATNSHKCSEEIGRASDSRRGTLSNVKPILIGVGLFSCGIVMDQVFQDLTLLHLQ